MLKLALQSVLIAGTLFGGCDRFCASGPPSTQPASRHRYDMIEAARAGDLKAVTRFLDAGEDPNQYDADHSNSPHCCPRTPRIMRR